MQRTFAVAVHVTAAVAIATQCAPAAQVRHVEVSSTVVLPFAMPVIAIAQAPAPPPPPTTAEPVACPPPRTDAPRLVPPELPEAITAVRPSPSNAGWIAAWNDEHVFVSTDAGATFRRVLDGEGTVRDVSFDCLGRVLAVRAGGVGVRDGDREVWRPAPGGLQVEDWEFPQDDGSIYRDAPEVSVLGGGPHVVIAGRRMVDEERRSRVAISRDLGATWAYHDIGGGHDEGPLRGRQHADGTVEVGSVLVDCMSEDLVWTRIGSTRRDATGQLAGYDFAFHDDGTVVSGRWWRQRDDAELQPIAGLPEDLDAFAVPGPRPMVISDGAIWKVRRGRATRTPLVVEGGDGFVADPAGRVWSVVCGQPWIARRSPSGKSC